MKIGKLSISQLKNLVFKNIEKNRKEVIETSAIGNDCASIKLGDGILYLSTDPITGTSKNLGKLLVNINSNDIATTGSDPIGLLVTILAPTGTSEDEITEIMRDIKVECDKVGIDILGGHTEITKSVNQIVASGTIIGYLNNAKDALKGDVKAGDEIIITKGIGIEGIGIIATEKEAELKHDLGEKKIEIAKDKLNLTSVLKDGYICKKYAKSMHDVTEGGLLGALWEISEHFNVGIKIDKKQLFVDEITTDICNFYMINPLRLISSGTMIVIADKKSIKNMQDELSKNNIESFNIGVITEDNKKIMIDSNQELEIAEPESDELFKVI